MQTQSYSPGEHVSTRLTTTSYALLGLVAIKPWTTYELTQQMQRSLRRFWPRAESKLYEEPRKLAARGLVTAQAQQIGKRRRTEFTVTADGRRELARWLSEPPAGPLLESEQLLKVFFAEHGTKQDLLATLAASRAWAEQHLAEDARIAQSYLDGDGRFPERTAQLALVGRYLSDFADMTARWAHWATGVVEHWPEEPGAAEPNWDSLQTVAARDDTGRQSER